MQDPCKAICARCLYEISTEDLCKRSPRVRSLFKLSINDLQARPLLSSPGLCIQDLHKRSPGKISVQDLYKSSVGKISVRDLMARSLHRSPEEVSWQDLLNKISIRHLLTKISVQDLYTRSLGKISYRDLSATDLCAMSLCKISIRGLLARSLYKISILGKISVRGLLARSLPQISLQCLRTRSP